MATAKKPMKKYGNGGKTSGVDNSTTNTTKGQMMKMSKGGKMKKYAAGGRVVPTVDNSMSKGGKVMAKKAMGGKMGKKAC